MAIVVDTSALAAVVFGEVDAGTYIGVLQANAGDVRISAATVVEAQIVVEGAQGTEATADLERLLSRIRVEIIPVDAAQAELATAAWRRFSKGRHAARLNFGDCFSYALSKQLGLPLLFKNRDFAQTDVSSAL